VEAIVAARALLSGDTLITFDKTESKEKWAKSLAITQGVGPQARIRTREYTILAYRIRVATIDVRN
jgi:hypothetical protein